MTYSVYYTYDKSHRLTQQYTDAAAPAPEAHYYTFNQRNCVTQIRDVGGPNDALRAFVYNGLRERVVATDISTALPAYWSYDGRKFLQDKQLTSSTPTTTNYRHNSTQQDCPFGSLCEVGLPTPELATSGYPAFSGSGSLQGLQDPSFSSDAFEVNWFGATILSTNNLGSRVRTFSASGRLEAKTSQEIHLLPGGGFSIPDKNLENGGPDCGPGEDEDPDDELDDLRVPNNVFNCCGGDDQKTQQVPPPRQPDDSSKPAAKCPPADYCKCLSLEINTTKIKSDLSFKDPRWSEDHSLPGDTTGKLLGPNDQGDQYIGYNFEIFAVVEGDPAKCTGYQDTKATMYSSTGEVINVPPPLGYYGDKLKEDDPGFDIIPWNATRHCGAGDQNYLAWLDSPNFHRKPGGRAVRGVGEVAFFVFAIKDSSGFRPECVKSMSLQFGVNDQGGHDGGFPTPNVTKYSLPPVQFNPATGGYEPWTPAPR